MTATAPTSHRLASCPFRNPASLGGNQRQTSRANLCRLGWRSIKRVSQVNIAILVYAQASIATTKSFDLPRSGGFRLPTNGSLSDCNPLLLADPNTSQSSCPKPTPLSAGFISGLQGGWERQEMAEPRRRVRGSDFCIAAGRGGKDQPALKLPLPGRRGRSKPGLRRSRKRSVAVIETGHTQSDRVVITTTCHLSPVTPSCFTPRIAFPQRDRSRALLHAQVEHFHADRERHGEVDVALRYVVVE